MDFYADGARLIGAGNFKFAALDKGTFALLVASDRNFLLAVFFRFAVEILVEIHNSRPRSLAQNFFGDFFAQHAPIFFVVDR